MKGRGLNNANNSPVNVLRATGTQKPKSINYRNNGILFHFVEFDLRSEEILYVINTRWKWVREPEGNLLKGGQVLGYNFMIDGGSPSVPNRITTQYCVRHNRKGIAHVSRTKIVLVDYFIWKSSCQAFFPSSRSPWVDQSIATASLCILTTQGSASIPHSKPSKGRFKGKKQAVGIRISLIDLFLFFLPYIITRHEQRRTSLPRAPQPSHDSVATDKKNGACSMSVGRAAPNSTTLRTGSSAGRSLGEGGSEGSIR
ncbi:hypothetical protein BDZ91DRAFT_761057 [Kalaharituber pfeilii]|nr:hypothetical protein BDZ91DRAFT_761057 [Kalaharituber pfeilii]